MPEMCSNESRNVILVGQEQPFKVRTDNTLDLWRFNRRVQLDGIIALLGWTGHIFGTLSCHDLILDEIHLILCAFPDLGNSGVVSVELSFEVTRVWKAHERALENAIQSKEDNQPS